MGRQSAGASVDVAKNVQGRVVVEKVLGPSDDFQRIAPDAYPKPDPGHGAGLDQVMDLTEARAFIGHAAQPEPGKARRHRVALIDCNHRGGVLGDARHLLARCRTEATQVVQGTVGPVDIRLVGVDVTGDFGIRPGVAQIHRELLAHQRLQLHFQTVDCGFAHVVDQRGAAAGGGLDHRGQLLVGHFGAVRGHVQDHSPVQQPPLVACLVVPGLLFVHGAERLVGLPVGACRNLTIERTRLGTLGNVQVQVGGLVRTITERDARVERVELGGMIAVELVDVVGVVYAHLSVVRGPASFQGGGPLVVDVPLHAPEHRGIGHVVVIEGGIGSHRPGNQTISERLGLLGMHLGVQQLVPLTPVVVKPDSGPKSPVRRRSKA